MELPSRKRVRVLSGLGGVSDGALQKVLQSVRSDVSLLQTSGRHDGGHLRLRVEETPYIFQKKYGCGW